ncbi:hypothetical protein BJX64DRAFT_293206 [Aspergillus heterothallicus]
MQSALAITRIAVGVGFLAIPGTLATLFHMPFTPETAIGYRMAGTRDIVLGVLLYTARSGLSKALSASDASGPKADGANRSQTTKGWAESQRALVAGIAADAVDILTSLWCYLDGSLPLTPALLIGVGASLALDMGIYCLYF